MMWELTLLVGCKNHKIGYLVHDSHLTGHSKPDTLH